MGRRLPPSSLTRTSTRLVAPALMVTVGLGLATGSRTLPSPTRAAATQRSTPAAGSLLPPSPQPSPLQLAVADIRLTDRTVEHRTGPPVIADGVMLIDMDTETVLWEHNPDEPRAPASTTKLMTALVALRNFAPDQLITVSPAAATRDPVETAMGLVAGQQWTVHDLLVGMLMVSANDAAWALADGTVGAGRFVDAMNAEAAALHLEHSHFANPSGYPDVDEQVSTPRDLATLMMVLWNGYPAFRDAMAVRDTVLGESAGHPIPLHSIVSRVYAAYPPTIAAKSGFTDNAGPCLVSIGVRGTHHLVAVLLNTRSLIDDNRTLLDWGFEQEGLAPIGPSPTATPGKPR